MKQKQEIRKGFEWFRTLTKKQQKRFRLATHRQKGGRNVSKDNE